MPLKLSVPYVCFFMIEFGLCIFGRNITEVFCDHQEITQIFLLICFLFFFPANSIFSVIFLFKNSGTFIFIEYLTNPICELTGRWRSKCIGNTRSCWWVQEWVTVKTFEYYGLKFQNHPGTMMVTEIQNSPKDIQWKTLTVDFIITLIT